MAEQQYIYVAAPGLVASPASYAGYPGYSPTTDTAYVQQNYAFQVTEQSATGTAYAVPSYQYEVQPATHYAAQPAGGAVSAATSQQQVLAEYPVAAASGQPVYSNQNNSQATGASTAYSHQVASLQTAYGQQAASYNSMPASSLQQTTPGTAAYTQQAAQPAAQMMQQQYGVALAYPQAASTSLPQQQQLAQYAIQQAAGQQQVVQSPGYAGTQVLAQQANIAYAQQGLMPGQAATAVYAAQQQQPAYLQQQQPAYLQQQQMTLPQPQQQQLYAHQQQQSQQQQQQHGVMQAQQQQQPQVMFPGHSNQQQQHHQQQQHQQQQHQPVRPLSFPDAGMQSGNNAMKSAHQRGQHQPFPNFPAGNIGAPSMPPSRGPTPSSSMVLGEMEIQKFPDTIFIQGLPDDTNEEMLVQHFSTFGKLKMDNRTGRARVSLVKDKATGRPRGEATVGYQEVTSANNAIKLFNNKEFNGRKIRIEVASRKVPIGQQPTQMQATKRNRPGEDSQDWVCINPMCSNQNFSWRTECNRCRAPKPSNPQLKSPIGLRMGIPGGVPGGVPSGVPGGVPPGGGAGNPGGLITMPTNNHNPHFNNHHNNNPLARPPLLGNGLMPGNNPHHPSNHNRPMLNHPANNMLGLRGPNIPGQSLRGRLGIGPIMGNMGGVTSLNGGPIRPAIRGRMDRRLGRPY